MAAYRNRLHGAVVEAVRFDPTRPREEFPEVVPGWLCGHVEVWNGRRLAVRPGDWITRDGMGSYPMSPQQFEMTFEPATETVPHG